MKIGKKLATLAIAAALAITFATPQAGNARPGDRQGPPPWMESLTPEQKATAKKILESNAPQMSKLRGELDAKRAELATARKSRTADIKAIESLSREIGELHGKMLVEDLALRAQLRDAGLPVDRMGRPGPKAFAGGRARDGMYRLNDKLSAEQKAIAQKILDQSVADMQATRKAIADKGAELDKALKEENPDKARIEQISREIGELHGKTLTERAQLRQKFADAGLPENTLAKKAKPRKAPKKPYLNEGQAAPAAQPEAAAPEKK